MVLVGRARPCPERFGVYIAIVLVSLLTPSAALLGVAGRGCSGRTGINLIGRVMGLILAAMAIQFVLDGMHEAFPKLTCL